NIVPGECRIIVEWRPIPGQDAAWAATILQEELEHLRREFPGFWAEFKITRLDPAFNASETNQLASLFESLTNRSSKTAAFGTEAAHLASITSDTVVVG